jgi:hypothetical protein
MADKENLLLFFVGRTGWSGMTWVESDRKRKQNRWA